VALTIVNEEVERLAQELGSQTGEPIPQLILTALQGVLAGFKASAARQGWDSVYPAG
jgi:hypothetical protein